MPTVKGSNRRESLVLLAAFVAGMALRLALLFTTVGSTDSMHVTMWGATVAKHGVAASYQLSSLINHPPASLAALAAAWRLGEALSVQTYQVVRAAQILADIITALLLVLLGRRFGRGSELAVLFLLTPAVMFISAFHCNTDPTMMMFIVAAVVAMAHERPAWSGALLAAAVNVKIVPLLLVPLFVTAAWPRLTRFVAAFAAVVAIGFVPALVQAGPIMIRNVFFYPGYAGEWGIPALLLEIARTFRQLGPTIVPAAKFYAFSAGKLVAVASIAITSLVLWWRSRPISAMQLGAGVSLMLLLLLFFTAGFGVQYLLWPLPLLPLLISRRAYIIVAGVVSAWLFYTYTIWSDGFPWWFADARTHFPGTRAYIVFGLVTWLTLGVTAAVALPRFLRGAERTDRVPGLT